MSATAAVDPGKSETEMMRKEIEPQSKFGIAHAVRQVAVPRIGI